MPSFPGVDYLEFDSVLSDEEKLARNTARQFVDDGNHAASSRNTTAKENSPCNWSRRWPSSGFSAPT